MLGSITPLGERGRGQRWAITVTAFAGGSVAAGATFGGALGAVGRVALGPAGRGGGPDPWPVWALAALIVAGAALDAGVLGTRLPTIHRQVNEDWLHRYRGWVYGLAFGLQLGIGIGTVVSISAVYVALAAALLSGSVWAGAVIGGAFGLLRAVPLFAVATVRRTDQLVAVDRRLRAWDRPARRWAIGAEAALAVVAMLLAVAVAT
jgi:sulfite exporter TauE/SafE